MKIERIDSKTGKTKIYEEQRFMSRHSCFNYHQESDTDSWKSLNDKDNLVEFKWWCTFDEAKKPEVYAEIVLWCKENCKGLIYGNPLSGNFEFELEEDAMAFRLKWM